MTPSPHIYLSLFSGVGGGDLAFQHLIKPKWRCVGYVEYEKYCQDVIRQRIEDGLLDCAPIFGDIREFNREYAKEYRGMVDLVTGGFPCQDISCAGKGAGIEGERSGLWGEMAEVVRQVRPKHVFVENSPMLTIRGLGTVLKDLAEMGFNARWGCISSAETGNIHTRERIWIVASDPDSIDASRIRKPKGKNMVSSFWKTKKTIKEHERWLPELVPIHITQKISSYSRALRILYEIPDWMDRTKACGNGQDSIVAATAWEILKPF